MENVYGFTTTLDDNYFERVVSEAAPDTDFLVIQERNTVTGQGTDGAVVLVRKDALLTSLLDPTLTFAGFPLIELLQANMQHDLQNHTPEEVDEDVSLQWATFNVAGDPEDVQDALDSLRHEIRRIRNVKTGRVIRVYVESL